MLCEPHRSTQGKDYDDAKQQTGGRVIVSKKRHCSQTSWLTGRVLSTTVMVLLAFWSFSHTEEAAEAHEHTDRSWNNVTVTASADSIRGIRLMDLIRDGTPSLIEDEEDVIVGREAKLQPYMRHLLFIMIAVGLIALLSAFSFCYLIHGKARARSKESGLLETCHLLQVQEKLNQELQHVNETLQVSEEKLNVTLNSIDDAVMATDAAGCVTLLNPRAEQLTGWMQSEAVGRPVADIFHIVNEETRRIAKNPIKETLALGTVQRLVEKVILITRQGSESSVADSCAPICDTTGHVVGAVMVFRDVTESRKAESRLEKVSEKLAANKVFEDAALEYSESMINTVREPLIVLDQDLRGVSVSRSFYDVFKVKPEETVGQLIYDLGNKQWDIPKLRELLETILPHKTTFDDYEVEHDFTTIGRRIMLLNARQIQRVFGKERIILLAIEDITKRREIENGLEKAHEELTILAGELHRTSRVKSEFLANMSHELRTPLNSINGFSEVLCDETFGPLNTKQKQYVNNVLTSGKHLLLLINQILDMAKVEAGKMNLTLSSLPSKGLLEDISLLVADMIQKKNLHMILEIAEDLPEIEADELKVKEIIYNLLSNAVKFSPDGGQIGMSAKRTNQMIEILIWDEGVGIAQENMGKIFEGFFRVDTPYSRVTEGTGLGLPLSKKLVELHGGTLSVESPGLNLGTQVRFTLPIVSRREAVLR